MSDTAVGVRVGPDRGRCWTVLVMAGLRYAVILLVFLGIWVLSDAGSTAAGAAGMFAFWCFMTVATGLPLVLWWRCGPGRVGIEVSEGELRVLRGARVVRRHPCADITALQVTDPLCWRRIMLGGWFSWFNLPRLYVDRATWPTVRLLPGARAQASILLWGRDRCAEAERALRDSVVAHGAVLRDET